MIHRFALFEDIRDVYDITDMFKQSSNNGLVAALTVYNSKLHLFLFLREGQKEDLKWLPGLIETFKKLCPEVCRNVTNCLEVKVEGLDQESYSERLPWKTRGFVPSSKAITGGETTTNTEATPVPRKAIERSDVLQEREQTGKSVNQVSSLDATVLPLESSAAECITASSDLGNSNGIEGGLIYYDSLETSLSLDSVSGQAIAPPQIISDAGYLSNTTSTDSALSALASPSAEEIAFESQFYRGVLLPLDEPLCLPGVTEINVSPKHNGRPSPIAIIRILARALAYEYTHDADGSVEMAPRSFPFGTVKIDHFDWWQQENWLEALASPIMTELQYAVLNFFFI